MELLTILILLLLQDIAIMGVVLWICGKLGWIKWERTSVDPNEK